MEDPEEVAKILDRSTNAVGYDLVVDVLVQMDQHIAKPRGFGESSGQVGWQHPLAPSFFKGCPVGRWCCTLFGEQVRHDIHGHLYQKFEQALDFVWIVPYLGGRPPKMAIEIAEIN